ncbi:MAG: DUF4124 domain-containing protein [Thauera propionica]|jgi:hypothetical protein|uniref:DUF4124 domain-containing protein n=1 Tax=Thauera propionica TaxID=2019431 RepID=A0A235EXN1_9RHOO|nr:MULTISPECIES: DUF4124 domain-containing protein [Thauera]MDD3676258.1 DUF4124 domain-containing protein [Thauera propionica]MDI3489932.1 hypothetical protein [Thauera sp.]MDY0046474.1 DUF4124 domain-containing protein [Thauera propionica]OYD53543.1 hypothetical protein CGK74_12770 [Thauera propionica]
MQPFRILPLILLLGAALPVQAEVYKCTDAEGRITYTNDRNAARGCKALDTDQTISTVPAPARRPSAGPATSPAGTPSSFPRVSPDDQRARDDSRRQVLEAELATEESALTAAEQALAEQESVRMGDERNYQKVLDRLQPFKDKVELHKRNIEALRREISGLR